jgi:hypothetical protein
MAQSLSTHRIARPNCLRKLGFRGARKSIIGGGQIFIYSCSQTVKTIAFKGNK